MTKINPVTKNFSELGEGPQYLGKHGQDFDYSVSGDFKGSVILERSQNGGQAWERLQTFTEPKDGSMHVELPDQSHAAYRFRAASLSQGSINTTIKPAKKKHDQIEAEKQGLEPGENINVKKSIGNKEENEAKLAELEKPPQDHLEPIGMNENLAEHDNPANVHHKKRRLKSA